MSSYDQAAIVAAYNNDVSATVGSVAKSFNISDPTIISTILKLNGVAIRRGNPNAGGNLSAEARAKGIEVRRNKALLNQMRKLIASYGSDAVANAFNFAIDPTD